MKNALWLAFVAGMLYANALSAAIIHSENFESASPPALPPSWSSRVSVGSVAASAVTEASGGDPGKDLFMSVDSSGTSSNWRFESIYTFAGPLPTSDLSQLSLTADLKANESTGFYVFNLWSYDATGQFVTGKADFYGATPTSYTPIGGLLSQANNALATEYQCHDLQDTHLDGRVEHAIWVRSGQLD